MKEGEDEVVIYPMGNFFSALAIVARSIFSALSVKVLICNNTSP
jgi:hypothetical protein